MKIITLISSAFIATVLSLAHAPANASQYHPEAGAALYHSYEPEVHGGGALSNHIVQDRHGNLFFANEAGILKFDGEHWSRLPATGHEGLTMALTIDYQERIWVTGTKTIGYYQAESSGYRYTDRTASVYATCQDDDFGLFWKLYADDQNVFLVTSFKVLRWNGSGWQFWAFEEPRRILPSWLDGALYIHARGSGLFKFNGNGFTRLAEPTPATASGLISLIAHTEAGLLCATVSNGLFLFRDQQFVPVPTSIDPRLRQTSVFHALQMRDGNLALATRSEGVLILDPAGQLISQINPDGDGSYFLFEDAGGCLWSAHMNALLKIPNLPLSRFADSAHDLARHLGSLYYTNLKALKTIVPRAPSAPPYPVSELYQAAGLRDLESARGELLGGNLNSLSILSEGKPSARLPSSRQIMDIFLSGNDPNLIYTSDSPRLSRWQRSDAGWQHLDTLADYNGTCSSLVELPDGQLLVSSISSPLLRIDWPLPSPEGTPAPTLLQLGRDHGLPDAPNWAHCLRLNATYLVITDTGLFQFDSETQRFRYDPVLGNDLGPDAYGLELCPLADGTGWVLWLPATKHDNPHAARIGALRIHGPQRLQWEPWQLPSIQMLGKVEALLHEHTDGSETLWVGGSKDLFRYDLSAHSSMPTPSASLASISEQQSQTIHFGGAGAPPRGVEWAYPQKSLRFEFAAPTALLQVHDYQTRLLGFEAQWSNAHGQLLRDFTNLREGSYTFEVRAIDEFGRTGPIERFKFNIRPPWYRTPYAYFTYLVALVFVLFLILRWWTLRLRRRNLELEQLVNQRTTQLERRNLDLIHANNVKQDFLASMSHEIRNPLNGILGIAQLLRSNNSQDNVNAVRINHLNSCANHLHQLLGQVLDYSSLEAGKLQPIPEPFNVKEVFEDAVAIHRSLAEQKALDIQFKCPAVSTMWVGDAMLLRQILINLISNAIKYTPSGWIGIHLEFTETAGTAQARFTVEDSGPGIPANKRAYIFEDFTRLAESGESTIPGTGLGLAIASQIAQLMGGQLLLDPDYSNGARFTLDMAYPLGDHIPEVTTAEALRPSKLLLRHQKVLVADDMDFNRYINKEFLEALGATVVLATDGRMALEQLTQGHFDFAILDINMPELSGIEVVTQFFSKNPVQPPVLIALSAHVTSKMEARCLESGFNHFIEKPLDLDKLEHIAAEHLRPSMSPTPAKPATPTTPASHCLLDYLADNDPKAKAALQSRYRDAFLQELTVLRLALRKGSFAGRQAAIHKLKGLSNIQRDLTVIELLDQFSTEHPTAADDRLEHLCDQLESRIDRNTCPA